MDPSLTLIVMMHIHMWLLKLCKGYNTLGEGFCWNTILEAVATTVAITISHTQAYNI